MKTKVTIILLLSLVYTIQVYAVWNNPYPSTERLANDYYASFADRPKTLDPAKSYSSNEYTFIAQVYEPPLQYHYLKRPYQLIPLTAQAMPMMRYLDKQKKELPNDTSSNRVAFTEFTIHIKPNIFYQPHPAFVKNKKGQMLYFPINEDFLEEQDIRHLSDFPKQATRLLTVDDYIYQMKRLADPSVHSPIYSIMKNKIVGLSALHTLLKEAGIHPNVFFDLRPYPLSGVKKIDDHTYKIIIHGKEPQFLYWLAMPFFSPMPWEVVKFYKQNAFEDLNLNLDWYPVGTGAFMLTMNDPNHAMILSRNPHFHGEQYPSQGDLNDEKKGLLDMSGMELPFLNKVVFSLEKESIPRWAKFLQGYYDNSGITSDSFDQAIQIDANNQPVLTSKLKDRGIRLNTAVAPSIMYLGFNMLDPIVGGYEAKKRKLRQAISIAVDYQEFISIFQNGRGLVAPGPIPPGIFGFDAADNKLVFEVKHKHLQRLPLSKAKQLLTEAGYPEGRDLKTGKTLVLNFDVPASSGPDDKARFDWMRKQFQKLGIQLHVRPTQYNRFQEKMRTGHAQLFQWGWNADYPDPENFLFLFLTENGKVRHGGENASNYANAKFDALFSKMSTMENSPTRLAIIKRMLIMLYRDAPWIWGFYPKQYSLTQPWVSPSKPNLLASNTLKYIQVNPEMRAKKREEYNKPVFWPLVVLMVLFGLFLIPIIRHYRKLEYFPLERIRKSS